MRRTPLIVAMVGALALAGCGPADGDDPLEAERTVAPTDETVTKDPVSPTPSPATTGTDAEDASPGDGDGEGDGDGQGEDGSSEVAAMAFAECENEDYTVGYPEDWNTNEPQENVDACRVFHPGEIDIEPNTDMDLHYAVSMYVDQVEFERVRDSDSPNEVLEERETTIDGRDALIREIRSTGDALLPEGERQYAYYVDLDGEMFVAATNTVGDTDYERDKEILDRMVTEELSFSG